MKKIYLLLLLSFIAVQNFNAQTSLQTLKRRNCSSVSRPIVDVGYGLVNGRATNLPKPHLSRKIKKLVRDTTITVNVEVDESGKVTAAKTDNENNSLQSVFEQTALQSKFTPTVADGEFVKTRGKITYEFKEGKRSISVELEPVNYSPQPFDYKSFNLVRIFDSKILSVITTFQSGEIVTDSDFVKNGQADIQICLGTKTPKILEKIKQTGFELLEETQGNGLVGRTALENLEKLTDIQEIKFIVPEIW